MNTWIDVKIEFEGKRAKATIDKYGTINQIKIAILEDLGRTDHQNFKLSVVPSETQFILNSFHKGCTLKIESIPTIKWIEEPTTQEDI